MYVHSVRTHNIITGYVQNTELKCAFHWLSLLYHTRSNLSDFTGKKKKIIISFCRELIYVNLKTV